MRFMILLKADRNTEAGVLPSRELLEAMGRYNEELAKAGVLLAGEGLQPTAKGARVTISGDRRTVRQGPFPLDQGVICGFWMFKTASLEEAIEWIKRCPQPTLEDSEVEIRQVFELEDFGEAATPDLCAREQDLRSRIDPNAR
jgi:hypothetical protein